MHPEHNPYDFITNHPAKTTDHKTKKLMFIAGIGLVLVLLLWVIAMFAGGNSSPNISSVAAKQENIIKVAEFGLKKAKSTETKNLAATVSAVVSSQNQELKATKYPEPSNELNVKTAADYKSIEEKLTAAEKSNNFDTEFISQINQLLKDYQQTLSQINGSKLTPKFSSQIAVILER